MKLSSLILTLSLIANLVLAGIVLASRAGPSSGGGDSVAVSSNASGIDGSATATVGKKLGGKSAAGATQAAPRTLWSRLRSDEDLTALVARMRAAGFPPMIIRRVIGTLISERFDARRLELEKDNFSGQFWQRRADAYNDPKIGPEIRRLQVEQAKMMEKILGENIAQMWADTEDAEAMVRMQIGNIAPEKIDRLYVVLMDYQSKRADAYSGAATGAALLPSDREKVVTAEKELRSTLAEFLTPQEASDFLMRLTNTAGQLRSFLLPFKATEEEYRTIFPIYQAFADQFPAAPYLAAQLSNIPPDQIAVRRAAEETLTNQLKAALGEQRAADALQVLDPNMYQLNRLVTRLDLPLSAAKQVMDIQNDAMQRANAIRSDTSLSGSDIRAAFNGLAQESSAKIATALGGARGLEAYKQYGGQWLVSITPRPPAAGGRP